MFLGSFHKQVIHLAWGADDIVGRIRSKREDQNNGWHLIISFGTFASVLLDASVNNTDPKL